ncbi:ribulokinase [Alicyclobacillus fastidiosus]|uniref:Ribulokinase n=1 Tax=Alicyclobacillus fastidiosus TaxID=392011 RepID=A0ABV5A927_9BACL|nr:ribulokinase [Alicyclobacillus fastidiosus]WEH10732.1 ribulokinase [Alicyclobacillus fastidiosus]
MAYSIGVDYGTGSGRVVLLDLDEAAEVAVAVIPYQHGVIDTIFPATGEKLPPDWALQHPMDYLDVLRRGIPAVLAETGVHPADVIGIGIDFTSCTVLPVTQTGEPLCMMAEWAEHPHAWPKLWKHHAAQPIADRMNQLARERDEDFLTRYGGRISSEWYFPKLIEVFEADPDVYQACDAFVEATDWIVWYLTGNLRRNSCTAGYKALWSEDGGMPAEDFFQAVNPGFTRPLDKLGDVFYPLGTRAGQLREHVAEQLGLHAHVAVAVGNVDAMVAVPSVGVSRPGSLVMVMGTSICHLTVSHEEVRLPGITGVVKGGALPGLYAYEAGQAAVGDMFEWFVKTWVPERYLDEATRRHASIYEVLEEEAARLSPGQNGLVAFDWWNGNRSILGDADVSGMIFGLTLATSTADVYRALLESTAYGTRRIIDNFAEHGIVIDELVACGGLPQKSPLLMQIYADICGLPVVVRDSKEIPARGAAMFGAVAAGAKVGGFDSITSASDVLAAPIQRTYQPNAAAREAYDRLYQIYRELHEYLGEKNVHLLHRLKQVRVRSLNDAFVNQLV